MSSKYPKDGKELRELQKAITYDPITGFDIDERLLNFWRDEMYKGVPVDFQIQKCLNYYRDRPARASGRRDWNRAIAVFLKSELPLDQQMAKTKVKKRPEPELNLGALADKIAKPAPKAEKNRSTSQDWQAWKKNLMRDLRDNSSSSD